jgi:hypothetical protein
MAVRPDKLAAPLERLDAALLAMIPRLSPQARAAVERWRGDAAALRFHLRDTSKGAAPITVVLGGTGTGKSTLVNRVVGATVTATSFRRTFTTGPVAVASNGSEVPADWLGVVHDTAEQTDLPARGRADALVIVRAPLAAEAASPVVVDTPDLDGDQPAHHAQADRAFRWAQRIVFVVTPEKYQMTELLPYYRLARRYAVPALFVMNKCEESAVVEDFCRQLAQRDWPDAPVFVVARDDAGYEPPTEANLDALRAALRRADGDVSADGIANRATDVVARLADQVIAPLRDARREADRLIAALRAMETPSPGVDVNPITQQLQRRLQQRSVLYLIGPQRVLDRVRQVPTLLARLPRATWDWVMRGEMPSADSLDPNTGGRAGEPPDFPAALADQFTIVRSRIDDVLRSNPLGEQWLKTDGDSYAKSLLDASAAAAIATEEIDDLKQWLEKRWNATPRDTRVLQAMLKYLPGGKRLTRWSEAAPYLLTLVLITHHAFFGHVDLLVLGGYSLATWLTERISNEVSSRTRAANRKIAERFERLAHEQFERVCAWIDSQAPSSNDLARLEQMAADLADAAAR